MRKILVTLAPSPACHEMGYIRQEEVDDVEVERDGGRNLLLSMHAAHDKLRVDQLQQSLEWENLQAEATTHNVRREQKGADAGVNQLHHPTVREEHRHKPKDNHHPQHRIQSGVPAGEIILRLARPQCQREKQRSRNHHRLQHNLRIIETRNHGHRIRLERREPGQQQQICRIGLALPVRRAEEPERADKR